MDLPPGLTSELLFLSVGLMLKSNIASPAGPATIEFDEDHLIRTFPDFLTTSLKHVEYKVRDSTGSKVSGNDKNSYSKGYLTIFGTQLPDGITYPELFCDVVRKVAEAVRTGKINPVKSLENVDGKSFGYFDGKFIQPSVIKQAEFYEQSTEFLAPTRGAKSLLEFDPVWFALLSLGFLWSYSGFHRGAYYLLTSPTLEAELHDFDSILGTVEAASRVNIKSRRVFEKEEVYELGLSLDMAEELESVKARSEKGFRWPLHLYKESILGRAFTAERILQIDLHGLVAFSTSYFKAWRKLTGRKPVVKINDVESSPLEALVVLAERELMSGRGVKGDHEMVAYLLVKDLHKAISSGSPSFMEEVLYRAARKSRGIQEKADIDPFLRVVLLRFFSSEHMEALMEAIGG